MSCNGERTQIIISLSDYGRFKQYNFHNANCFVSFVRIVSSDGSESFVYGKNTVVMSSGQSTDSAILDRSPCGSGTAAIMANLFGKGKLKIGIFLLFFSYRNYE